MIFAPCMAEQGFEADHMLHEATIAVAKPGQRLLGVELRAQHLSASGSPA